jgi:branched-chain amino acid transport system substrate-binding protein
MWMQRISRVRLVGACLVLMTVALTVAWGGVSSAQSTADPLGKANPAKGKPIVFGLLNDDSGPVAFPEVRLAEEAAVKYVNTYLNGIGGRPIKLVECITDLQSSTSQRCANQILDKHPVAIMGAADPGSPGSIPVYQRAGLAYLGGVPFTPVEGLYKNAAIFSSISIGDNAAASVFAAKTLKATTAAVIYTDDPPGNASANVIVPTMKRAGVQKITRIPIPQTVSDPSSYAAAAISAHPDVIYVDSPNLCPGVLKSLKQLGNSAKLLGIDPCTAPPSLAAASGGADGLYFASPVLSPVGTSADARIFQAALKKYAPANIIIDSLSAIGFQTVVDVQGALSGLTASQMTTKGILAAVRSGSHTNFLGHPYTCNGKQLSGQPAICNAFEQIRQVSGTNINAIGNFISAATFYRASTS